jgi:hypothetical protein
MVLGRPAKSKNDEGKNLVWDRHGDDCAMILHNLANEDGYSDWNGFQKDPSFQQYLKKYVKVNLKRNFEKTVKRYDQYLKDGGGAFAIVLLFYCLAANSHSIILLFLLVRPKVILHPRSKQRLASAELRRATANESRAWTSSPVPTTTSPTTKT